MARPLGRPAAQPSLHLTLCMRQQSAQDLQPCCDASDCTLNRRFPAWWRQLAHAALRLLHSIPVRMANQNSTSLPHKCQCFLTLDIFFFLPNFFFVCFKNLWMCSIIHKINVFLNKRIEKNTHIHTAFCQSINKVAPVWLCLHWQIDCLFLAVLKTHTEMRLGFSCRIIQTILLYRSLGRLGGGGGGKGKAVT